jgi:hypothetical protein
MAVSNLPKPGFAPVAGAFVAIAVKIAGLIAQSVAADKQKRADFTRKFVAESARKYPGYNVAIIHTRHEATGKHIHNHVEVDINIGGTIGYEIYYSRKGNPFTLTNKGDGGFLNWAYNGEFARKGMTISAAVHG